MSQLFSARTILLIASIALLNLFFFRTWDGAGTIILLGLLYFLIIFTNSKRILKHQLFGWVAIYSAGIFISMVVVLLRSNNFVQGIAVLFAELSLLSLWNSLQASQIGIHSFAELVFTPLTAVRNHLVGLARFFLKSAKVTKPTKTAISSQKIKSLIIGVLISLPVLAVVVSLLASGDPIFQKTIQDLFDIQLQIDERIAQRIVLSLILGVLLIPFLQRQLGVAFTSPFKGLARFNLTTEYSVVVLLLTLVLGFFLVIQWKYIFVSVAAETDLSQFGVATYSEYVTRGFAELQFVSLIIYSVVWLGLILMRSAADRHSVGRLKFLQLLLLTEFGIFLVSLFRRVWLYQDLHGMTVVRAYGAFFIFVVTLFALTLAGRHLTNKTIRWVNIELGILLSALLLFSSINVEHYLAVYHPPTVNHRIDFVYLSKLSTDGSAGWQRALTHAEYVLTDPKLNRAELINTDQRREIAYAGTIVQTLQIQHYRLLQKYGTPSELNNFYTESLTRTDARYTDRLQQILEQAGSETATTATILAEREKVRATLAEITTHQDAVPAPLSYSLYNLFYGGNLTCTDYRCFLSFFDWQEYHTEPKSVDTIEQFFSYNYPAYRLYEQRENILPLKTLLDLEQRYFELLAQIQRQPENEQSFSVDISYYTPFVEDP